MSETAAPTAPVEAPAAPAAAAAPTSVLSTAAAAAPAPAAETPAAEAAPDAPAEQAAEVVYEFTPPEGMLVDEAMLDRFKAGAKEAGLSAEAFAKLAPVAAEIAQGMRAEAAKAWADMQAGWVAKIQADPELAGEAPGTMSAAASASAARALDAFGGDELREALNLTGAGNHPALVRAFVQIGKALTEDKLVLGKGVPAEPVDFATAMARRTYTAMG